MSAETGKKKKSEVEGEMSGEEYCRQMELEVQKAYLSKCEEKHGK